MEVNTNQFEFSHGRKPRGRGNWGFEFRRSPNEDHLTFWHMGTYSEAKRAAVREAKACGAWTVVVLP